MIVTTMLIAAPVLALLWFFILCRVPWPWAGYAIVFVVGMVCLLSGTVHMIYVGIEIAALGSLLIWSRHHWWPPSISSSQQSNFWSKWRR